MCVQGKHEAMEAGSSGGDGGQVGAHSLTRSKVTFLNVHTEVKGIKSTSPWTPCHHSHTNHQATW